MSRVDDAFHVAEALEPDDRLRLIARLWASVPPEHWSAPSAEQLAGVKRQLGDHAAGDPGAVPWQIIHHLLAQEPPAARKKLYSVPRRFDLATIFVVTTAYSLLFAGIAAIQAPAIAFVLVAGFITLVGIGQALLFRGRKPRLASVLVGTICYTVPTVGMWVMADRMYPGAILVSIIFSGIFTGGLLGYIAGVLIGGVFLVTDVVRRRFSRSADGDAAELAESTNSNVSTP